MNHDNPHELQGLDVLAELIGGVYDKTMRRVVWPYEIQEGTDYVPMERWGKDHKSVLLYLESRSVNYAGLINNLQMRCHPRLHREFMHRIFTGQYTQYGERIFHDAWVTEDQAYPTRLADGETLDQHDDWSCAEDMVAANLLTLEWWEEYPGEIFGAARARVRFRPLGMAMAAELRAQRSLRSAPPPLKEELA